MRCSLSAQDCYLDSCVGCIFRKRICPSEPFNYECPDCDGKFMTPVVEETRETKPVDIKEIGNAEIIARHIRPILRYKCPFCGWVMEGFIND